MRSLVEDALEPERRKSNSLFLVSFMSVVFGLLVGAIVISQLQVTPEPIEVIKYVDKEVLVDNNVLVFGCEPDQNSIDLVVCSGFSKYPVYPGTQEELDEITSNLGECQSVEGGVVCVQCLEQWSVGWQCIDQDYIDELESEVE